MAEQLKFIYNPEFFEELCPVMCKTIPDFDCHYFIHRIFNNDWPDLEFDDRVFHVVQTLHDFLPCEFTSAAAILVYLAEELQLIFPNGHTALKFLPEYIVAYGQDSPEVSLWALDEIQKLVAVDFAIDSSGTRETIPGERTSPWTVLISKDLAGALLRHA